MSLSRWVSTTSWRQKKTFLESATGNNQKVLSQKHASECNSCKTHEHGMKAGLPGEDQGSNVQQRLPGKDQGSNVQQKLTCNVFSDEWRTTDARVHGKSMSLGAQCQHGGCCAHQVRGQLL